MAREPGGFLKASRRDLGWAVAHGRDATTTVSATLRLARHAGIHVMATGGLGGVHRDAATTFDVSTDLDELARADGALVVCSGVKSILDVPATLEVLETRGVPVVGYGTAEFPAFTSRSSGLPLEARVDSPGEAAAVVAAHRALGLPGAVVLAQPVAADVALDRDLMEAAAGGRTGRGPRAGRLGQGPHPVPPRPPPRGDRGKKPGGQHRPDRRQRRPRRGRRRGAWLAGPALMTRLIQPSSPVQPRPGGGPSWGS